MQDLPPGLDEMNDHLVVAALPRDVQPVQEIMAILMAAAQPTPDKSASTEGEGVKEKDGGALHGVNQIGSASGYPLAQGASPSAPNLMQQQQQKHNQQQVYGQQQ